ncbi:hypothetical protein C1645_839077 [Glomus cerebriforme]|uniref:Uncharacterized protein n=1 Tax=Glomus cerebriforme TaxID=658196 RepID=A0A397S2M8_9GLOM|nr:hypothetical protein C1645_839077 [Glomus cerebriforme]
MSLVYFQIEWSTGPKLSQVVESDAIFDGKPYKEESVCISILLERGQIMIAVRMAMASAWTKAESANKLLMEEEHPKIKRVIIEGKGGVEILVIGEGMFKIGGVDCGNMRQIEYIIKAATFNYINGMEMIRGSYENTFRSSVPFCQKWRRK